MKKIRFSAGLNSIDSSIYRGTANFEYVYIPDSVQSITYNFDGCENLIMSGPDAGVAIDYATENEIPFVVDSHMTVFSDFIIEDGVFNTYLGSDTDITVPETVGDETITSVNLMGNTAIESISLPETVEAIDVSAFEGCTQLKSVSLPSGVKTIGRVAFSDCTSLESINLDNVTDIDEYAFYNCSQIKEITLGENQTVLSRNAFADCTGITKLTVKNRKTNISAFVTSNAENISVYSYIGSNAQYWADYNDVPFYNLENDELIVPLWVVTTDGYIMKYKGSETDVTIPAEVNTIGVTALDTQTFVNSTALEAVHIPSCVTEISVGIFENFPDVIIYGEEGSAAEAYATENDLQFVAETI